MTGPIFLEKGFRGPATLALLGLGLLPTVAVYLNQTRNFSVYHDELWNYPQAVAFLNRASWRPSYDFQFLGEALPLLSGPYQGALKTYLLVPWLAVFGTSPWSLRGVNLLLCGVLLLTLRWALIPLVGTRWSRMALAATWFVPAMFAYGPTDQGPFLLASILAAGATGSLLRWGETAQQRWLALGVLSASLMVYDKLTALPVALAIVVPGLFLRPFRETWSRLVSWPVVLAALVPLVPWVLFFARHGFDETLAYASGPGEPLRSRLTHWPLWLSQSLASTHMVALPPGTPPLSLWLPYAALAGGGLVLVSGWLRLTSRTPQWRQATLSALSLGLAWVGFALVPGLYRPWHFFPLVPLLITALAAAVPVSVNALASRALRILPLAVLATVLTHDLLQAQRALWRLKEPEGSAITSPALYQLRDALYEQRASRLVCLNYSLCNPLYVLLGGKVELWDLTWWEENPNTWKTLIELLGKPGSVAVWRVPAPDLPDGERRGLEARVRWIEGMMTSEGPPLQRLVFPDRFGNQMVLARLNP